jgi:peptidoglycan/LPS O-acetylase OafA/YrhL
MTVESLLDAPRHSTRHLYPLTGIRIFAAAAIVEGHSWQLWKPSFLYGMSLQHGVSIFFVLSGFILAYSYPTIADVRKRQFFLARFARIWPMHIFATIVLFAMVPSVLGELRKPGEFFTILHYVTLTHGWYPTWQNFLAFNGVSWSISAEAAFYLTFPLWITNWGKLNWAKLPLACAPVVFLIQYANMGTLSREPWAPGMTLIGLMHFFPLARLPEFVLGVVIGEIWTRNRYEWKFVVSIIAEFIVVALILLEMAYAFPIANNPHVVQFFGTAGAFWLEQNGFAPIFALFIFVIASSTGPVARILGWKPIVILGEISFSVYLLHTILLRYYLSFPAIVADPPELMRWLYWCAVIAASFLAFELIEMPARAKITKKTPKSSIAIPKTRVMSLLSAGAVVAAALVAPIIR